jgi:hypothetical protein
MESQRVHETGFVADTAREQLAERRRRANRWYYPVFAVIVAVMVLAFATGEAWMRLVAILGCVGANVALGYAYRAVVGAPVPRLWQGPATLYAAILLVFLVAAVLLVRPAVEAADSLWPAWVLAAATFAAALAFGVVFERAVLRREAARPA